MAAMGSWIDQLATAYGDEPLTQAEVNELLGVARDVAHRVERKITPLSTFLLGIDVGRRTAGGAARATAMADALETLRSQLPDAALQAED